MDALKYIPTEISSLTGLMEYKKRHSSRMPFFIVDAWVPLLYGCIEIHPTEISSLTGLMEYKKGILRGMPFLFALIFFQIMILLHRQC
jgi:hypothetical protein